MIQCRKCNSDRIFGPKYERNGPTERLRYTCMQCGWSETTPCKDAKEKEQQLRKAVR